VLIAGCLPGEIPSGADGAIAFGFRGFYLPRDGVVATCKKGRITCRGEGLVLEKQGKTTRMRLAQPLTYQRQLQTFTKRASGELSAPDGPARRGRDALYEKAGLDSRGTCEA